MRRLALAMIAALLAAAPSAAEEEDSAPKWPEALRAGAAASFKREADDDRLAGTVEFRVEAGEEGTVRLVREYATGDVGPLTFRDRLTAILDVASRRVRSFVYEGAGGKGDLMLLSRMGPDPDREDRFLHERFKYREEGEPQRIRTRLKLDEPFVPDLLEPFLACLLEIPAGKTTSVRLLTVARGRLIRKPVVYRSIGEGRMDLSEEETVRCRILTRTRLGEAEKFYLRAGDGMPLLFGPLTIRVKEDPR